MSVVLGIPHDKVPIARSDELQQLCTHGMQDLSQTLKQDLRPAIEWRPGALPSCQRYGEHAANRIRDVAS